MPTGYTAAIGEGVTFNEFVMRCARAMGACITLRDEPVSVEIPEAFEPSTHNAEQLKDAEARLTELKAMKVMEADKAAKKEYAERVAQNEEAMKKNDSLRQKYEEMLRRVEAWQPPSTNHVGLKDFMIEQITQSVDFDCSNRYYIDNGPKLTTGEQWLSAATNQALKDIDYHAREQSKERERANSRTVWVRRLRSSLNNIQGIKTNQ